MYDPEWLNVLSSQSPAIPAAHAARAVIEVLVEEHGFSSASTLLGVSINMTVAHDFAPVLQSWAGSEFRLADDSGMPLCGKTVRARAGRRFTRR